MNKKSFLHGLIDYILFLILALGAFYIGLLFKDVSIILSIVMIYFAIALLLAPMSNVKYIKWVAKIFLVPILLFKPIVRNLQIIVITSVGIFFFLGCMYALLRSYELTTSTCIGNQFIIFLSTTVSFILSTQKWYGGIIDSIANRYHSTYQGMKYQPELAKFLIYVYYLVALVISYTFQFLGKPMPFTNSSVLLASFAIFLAYDRLMSNKKLLEKVKWHYASDREG